MASDWTVLVFGDSWAEYMHPCWPEVLGRRMSARVFNFASAGSLVHDLHAQASRALASPLVPKAAGGLLKKETLVVVHTCGNDFIMKMVEGLIGSGGLLSMFGGAPAAAPMGPTPEILRPNPGAREVEVLRQFLEMMHRAGARRFLVSGVPAFLEMPIWNMLWPIVGNLVNQGKLQEIGVGPGDAPKLAMEVQATALHEHWESMVTKFGQAHPDSECIFFDEVGALERLRAAHGAALFDRSMWDMSMFHPTAWGHEQLASEAHRCTTEHCAPLSILAPHPEIPAGSRKCNKQAAPAAPAAGAATGPSAGSADKAAAPAATAPPEAAKPAAATGALGHWECETCTLHNNLARTVCEACDTPRPRSVAALAVVETPPSVSKEGGEQVHVHVRNVKGDVSFHVPCDQGWAAPRLKEAVLAAAPAGFAGTGNAVFLALKGKFLGDGPETLAELGIGDRTQLIAVLRPAAAAPAAKAFSPPART